MNKKLIIIGVLGLAGFGYYFYNKKKKDTPVLADTSVDETNVSIKSTTSIPQNVKPDWNKILKKGSKGIEVRTLQKALKKVDVEYNQSIINLQNIKSKQLKEAQAQKLKDANKVVAQAPPKTSFTDGLIKPLGT